MLLAVLTMIATCAAQGQVDMRGSVHDLSYGGNKICVYCHISASASDDVMRSLGSEYAGQAPFSMYASASMDMSVAPVPGDVSLLCLSCHDGVTAFNSVNSSSGAYSAASGRLAIGANGLADDHPIAVEYDPSRDPDFAPITNGKVGVLPLYGRSGEGNHRTQVECSSCHDPHESVNDNLLRMSNDGSKLCLTCHRK